MKILEGELSFLRGEGEMSELIRSKDWSNTSIGDAAQWPQSLRTSVSILLNSKFPMFVWWGKDHITIYNDAYRVIAGDKHPEALGLPGAEVWSEIWDVVGPLARAVFDEGVSTWADDQLLYVNRHGYVEETYFTYSYSPVFDESGGIGGVFCACTETTEKVFAKRKSIEREEALRHLLTEAPVAICIVTGENYIVDLANEGMLQLLGRTDAMIGKPIAESLTEAKQQGLLSILDAVRQTGETYSINTFPVTLIINGVRQARYFDLVFKPYQEDNTNGVFSSIFCVGHNVTDQVLTQKKLKENESNLLQRVEERTSDLQEQKAFIASILNASFNGIYALRAVRNSEGVIVDFEYLFTNNIVANILNKTADELMGTSMLKTLPESIDNGFFDVFCNALQTGKPEQGVTHFIARDISAWFDYVIMPIDAETLVVTTHDITQQKQASLQIEQQRNLLDNILKYSPSAITVTEVIRDNSGKVTDGKTIVANTIAEKYLGVPLEQIMKNSIGQIDPNFIASSAFTEGVNTLLSGEPFMRQYYLESSQKWLELSVGKLDDERWINVFSDVTATKKAELEMLKSVERLAAVFNASQSGMFTFSPVFDANQEIIDFRFVITNANFASYVGQTPEVLEGALGSTWFPGYLTSGVFDIYKTSFITGETQRRDVHYNEDGLDIYIDLLSTKVGDEILVTFTDYTELKKVQIELEKHIAELKRSNANLEEFTHAASHDLKEPVRKMQVFFDRFKTSLDNLSPEQEFLVAKVHEATRRMSSLIDDLLDYSEVRMGVDLVETIDLNRKLQAVITDLEVAIQDKWAVIDVGDLPTIQGHRRQFQQLFHNLIQNALKYSKHDIPPHISITSTMVKGKNSTFSLPADKENSSFYLIEVSDNGIGFNQSHAERIFLMFKRLHGKAEYEGSGVGLAIVRKVVENHHGEIAAVSQLGEGTTFKILLPVN